MLVSCEAKARQQVAWFTCIICGLVHIKVSRTSLLAKQQNVTYCISIKGDQMTYTPLLINSTVELSKCQKNIYAGCVVIYLVLS